MVRLRRSTPKLSLIQVVIRAVTLSDCLLSAVYTVFPISSDTAALTFKASATSYRAPGAPQADYAPKHRRRIV
jgi:hypothetical protein